MLHQRLDVAIITETRWTYENAWTDQHFHYVRTGESSHTGMGILCILAKSFCHPDRLRWRAVIPGRLLHVQVQMHNRCLDLIGRYQHTQASGRIRQQARAQLWEQLDQLLHGLVTRDILALAGDFNCNLFWTLGRSH